jgi:uncharacterized UBP type Zn finger protein
MLCRSITYELYASLVHKGTSANCGHYYSFAKDGRDK